MTKGGIISTQAGSSASGGFAGDGGAATSADLNAPLGGGGRWWIRAAISYIADTKNDLVRKVTRKRGRDFDIRRPICFRLQDFTGDGGVATSAAFNGPAAVAMDKANNLYVVDIGNNRIRKVTASTGIITTIAGTNGQGFSGDGGLATIARLSRPLGVAVDSSGTVYIADSQNNRIRKVVGSTITTIVGTGAPAFFRRWRTRGQCRAQ